MQLAMLQAVYRGIQGFTQIELAVTVLVIGILATIAAPSLQKWQQQKKVDQAVIVLDNVIRETQGEAIKRSQDCELIIREDFNPQSSGATPLARGGRGNCVVNTSDLEFVGVQLTHTGPTRPEWSILFNARGENRNPPNGPGTAIFSIPNTNVRPKCIVLSVGIGLRRSGQWDQSRNQCITT